MKRSSANCSSGTIPRSQQDLGFFTKKGTAKVLSIFLGVGHLGTPGPSSSFKTIHNLHCCITLHLSKYTHRGVRPVGVVETKGLWSFLWVLWVNNT